jgi:flagellar biosynthesis chaperone FliJ
MANNSIDTIIKMATELKAKMGEDEKQIPAWIQDHIAKAENLISQASGNYHEYGDSNESVNEDVNFRDGKYRFYSKQGVGYLTYDGKVLSDGDYDFEGGNAYWMSHSSWKGQKAFDTGKDVIAYFKKNKIVKESVNEAPEKSTGEKIQNLNNRIKALKDKMAATKSQEQKNLIQQRLKNALQSLSNYRKQNVSKESVVGEISSNVPKIFVKTAAVEKKIKELMADRKKAVVPYNSETDPTKKEKLKQILIKLTNQIKGYEKNLIQLRDKEEEYLQQLHSDAELDTTGL